MNAREKVTVIVGGKEWPAIESITVTAAVKEAARSYTLKLPPAKSSQWAFTAGAEIEIRVAAVDDADAILHGPDLLLKGYVDRFRPEMDATHASITVSGRSKSADMVDSAAEMKGGELRNATVLDLARKLDRWGLNIASPEKLETRALLRLNPGETAFRAVERYCRDEHLTLMGRADGGVDIVKAGKKRHAGGLIEGQNIKKIAVDHDWSGRYSRYVVRGQAEIGHGADALEIEKIVKDAAVKRDRAVVIVLDRATDKARAEKHGKARKNRQAGQALRATVTVQGFRDEAGQVWEPNRLVWLESPFGMVFQDMLIEGVTYRQDENGSVTDLTLVDPKAYDGKGEAGKAGRSSGKSGSTGDGWRIGPDEVE